MRNFTKTTLLLCALVLITSCGHQEAFGIKSLLNEPIPEAPPEPSPNKGDGDVSALKLCSKLDFNDITWPTSLTALDRDALKVALNISGSFEGQGGWGNISNNFDGTGLSLGLLNQTLGTGSLEPLLIDMRNNNYTKMESILSTAHFQSVLDMLLTWERAGVTSLAFTDDGPTLSQFDIGFNEGLLKAASRNQAAINWAQGNLYQSNGHFKPDWLKELVVLAELPEYVSIQVKSALRIHQKSVDYESSIGARELRAYLMMFDINVQNGGIYTSDWNDFKAYLKGKPDATVTERLEKILELRLRHVNTQSIADVRARKLALIYGHGVVHGDSRKLETEYCYSGALTYR
jgi:hypothetical protein